MPVFVQRLCNVLGVEAGQFLFNSLSHMKLNKMTPTGIRPVAYRPAATRPPKTFARTILLILHNLQAHRCKNLAEALAITSEGKCRLLGGQ
jgi:hypothetical protein